jgi:alkaline phosphatase D
MTESRRVIQISDTHLSAKRAYALENWEATLSYIGESQPDLVIHTGDIALDDPDDQDDLKFGFEQLNRIPVPWKAVPGGHDVGDSPPDPWQGQFLTKERLDRYLHYYQSDKWGLEFGDWYFIGFNCQLFESNLAEEEETWDFISDHIGLAGTRKIALFFHKPPFERSFLEDSYNVSFIPRSSRQRLYSLVRDTGVSLMAVGHRHTYLTFRAQGVNVVAAPTTGMIQVEDDQARYTGVMVNGCVEYIFHADGVHYRLLQPPGVKLIDYGDLDESIPRGSRFLPLFPKEGHR